MADKERPSADDRGYTGDDLRELRRAFLEGVSNGLPKMHKGGIVPKPGAADVPIQAQAGEGVIPASHLRKDKGEGSK